MPFQLDRDGKRRVLGVVQQALRRALRERRERAQLVDERIGLLAEPQLDASRSAANLADAICALYERDLDALGAAGRRHVVGNYGWTRSLQSLMARYQEAVSARLLPADAVALTPAEPAP